MSAMELCSQCYHMQCSLQVPSCLECGGILKPDLVFFGDNVACQLVDYIYSLVDDSDTLLVLGSSLFVSQLIHSHINNSL